MSTVSSLICLSFNTTLSTESSDDFPLMSPSIICESMRIIIVFQLGPTFIQKSFSELKPFPQVEYISGYRIAPKLGVVAYM